MQVKDCRLLKNKRCGVICPFWYYITYLSALYGGLSSVASVQKQSLSWKCTCYKISWLEKHHHFTPLMESNESGSIWEQIQNYRRKFHGYETACRPALMPLFEHWRATVYPLCTFTLTHLLKPCWRHFSNGLRRTEAVTLKELHCVLILAFLSPWILLQLCVHQRGKLGKHRHSLTYEALLTWDHALCWQPEG